MYYGNVLAHIGFIRDCFGIISGNFYAYRDPQYNQGKSPRYSGTDSDESGRAAWVPGTDSDEPGRAAEKRSDLEDGGSDVAGTLGLMAIDVASPLTNADYGLNRIPLLLFSVVLRCSCPQFIKAPANADFAGSY